MIERNRVLVDRDVGGFERFLGGFAGDSLSFHPDIDQHQVIVCAPGNQPQPLLLQFRRKRLRVLHNLTLVLLEIFAQSLAKSDGLGGDDVDQWTTLDTRKEFAVDLFGMLFFAQNQPGARPAQSLVRRRRNVISMRHWRRIQTRDY